jgi:hypothetical protein
MIRILLPILLCGGCGALHHDVSPLIGAVRSGDGDRALALIRSGADPNLPGGVNGCTPLMHAIHKGQGEMVKLLLKNGADPNLRAGGTTALLMAAGYGYHDMVETLLRAGADPHATTANGENALDYAAGGMADIDRMTVGQCQTETVRAILRAAPDLRVSAGSRTVAKLGRCEEVLQLLGR